MVDSLLAKSSIKMPPVPVEDIVRTHGVTVRYSDLRDVSGLVVRKDGAIVIGVNRTHAPARRRFTLAHEFGHALLHTGREVMFDKDFRYNLRSDISQLGIDIEEIEANYFAAALLMPRKFMDRDPRTHSIEVEDASALRALAQAYGVSAQAMALRLVNVARRASSQSQGQLPF